MELLSQPRYGIDAYLEWVRREGLRVHDGVALDLFELETADWPRYGVKGAVANFKGSGDFCNMFVLEIPAGAATLPQRHLYEEIYYVLDGRGSTALTFAGGQKRSFEWGPRSLFAIPLNAHHQLFNASGSSRALLATTTTLPHVMKTFRNDQFIFETPFEFSERIGKDSHYTGGGDLYTGKPGNNVWETNFVPDLATLELFPWDDRGAGNNNIIFQLGDGMMHAHMSEIAPAAYKKAHRHPAGFLVLMLTGNGYSLLWEDDGREFTRIDWKHGVVFPPCNQQFHQHFVTSNEASRYIATGMGGMRYPFTERYRDMMLAKDDQKIGITRSYKDGGDQIEYEDQDPRVHAMWLEELKRKNVTPRFELPKVRV